MYRATEEQIRADQDKYKKEYKPFRPFMPTDHNKVKMSAAFMNLLVTQNGQDVDDYCVEEDNKVEKYLSELPKGSDVLLLGTGTGREVLVAKDLGYHAVGTTLGSRNIDFGVGVLGLSPSELRECLNEDLPFRNETFDCVAGFQIFEHTLAPLLFVLEQTRVLKYGGKLLLEWPTPDKFTMDDNPHHQVCFTPGQAHALFRKAGLSDIKLYYDDFTEIDASEFWRGDQNEDRDEVKMLCIEGVKIHSDKDYINNAHRL